jgi:hypothetical protein
MLGAGPEHNRTKALLSRPVTCRKECHGQRRFEGGGAVPSEQAIVKAVCLSLVGDGAHLENLWAQEWVQRWDGWKELEEDSSDDMAIELAHRFLSIAGMNAPIKRKSNRQRLKELETQKGLRLQAASSHGVNNCLIDALLLGLVAQGLAPGGMTLAKREALCAACRAVLHKEQGVPFGVYLDGHRDTPRILQFFTGHVWKVDASVRVCLYDALDHAELGLRPHELDHVDVECGRGASSRAVLHVYNQTVATGQGYHFDALLDESATVACPKDKGGTRENEVTQLRPVAGKEAMTVHGENPVWTPNATEGAVQTLSVPGAEDVQMLLQAFFRSRGVQITVHMQDACDILACWQDREALCTKLHTLQQSGLAYADSGWHAAMRLVDQWLGYCNSCRQGPGQKLGTGAERSESKGRTDRDASELAREHVAVGEGGGQATPNAKKRARSPREDRHSWVPVKRLRQKTGASAATSTLDDAWCSENVEGENVFILRCAAGGCKDVRQVAEGQITALSKKLNEKPTLPLQYQNVCSPREAYDLPLTHCSFAGCRYASESEEELADHILSSHAEIFAQVCGTAIKAQDMLGMYAAAITWRCQSAAPVANVSIDRRALRAYQKSLEADNISCLLCFVCARKYPYVRSSRNQEVGWVQPVDSKNKTIFGQSLGGVEGILGMHAFRKKYVD